MISRRSRAPSLSILLFVLGASQLAAACSGTDVAFSPGSTATDAAADDDSDDSDDPNDEPAGDASMDAAKRTDAGGTKRDGGRDSGRDVVSCQPDCAQKSCGDDGCGGSCGTCGSDRICNEGACVPDDYCVSSSPYVADQYCQTGCCPGAPHRRYEYGGTNGFGSDYFLCACSAACIVPSNNANEPYCKQDADCCAGSHCNVYTQPGDFLYGLGFCTPDTGTSCQSAACTASHGSGGCCQWTPFCRGAQGCTAYRGYAGDPCADDEACESGLTCVNGKCKAPCTPSCNGKACGDDGCGGSCGSCSTGNHCVQNTCEPNCVPSCAGKSCGNDGCGGSCGTCAQGTCSAGTCVAPACDPVDDTGCPTGEGCILLSSGQSTCAVAGTGVQGSPCSATKTCAGGYACFAGTCRKICDKASGDGCAFAETCTGVTGWAAFGACQ